MEEFPQFIVRQALQRRAHGDPPQTEVVMRHNPTQSAVWSMTFDNVKRLREVIDDYVVRHDIV